MCVYFLFATTSKERTFSVQVLRLWCFKRRNQNRVLFTFSKRFWVFKIRLSLKRTLYFQIQNTLLLHALFVYTFFFVCLLRLTLYCQNLVVRFVICSVCHKMLRNTTTTTTGWGANATWEPGEPWLLLHCLTFSNFSGVCVWFVVYSCHMSAQKGTIFDKIFFIYFCVVLLLCFVSPPALIEFCFCRVVWLIRFLS